MIVEKINKCEFYPKEKDDPICTAGSDISGSFSFICTVEYGKKCRWAMEERKHKQHAVDDLTAIRIEGRD